jgi:hypothetical protein
MPTIVTNSIGTASRTYSTLQAWEDACPANLVTADQVWKGECYNDSEFTASSATLLNISGMTTDATRYVWLTAASGQSFADHANKLTNPQRYDQTKGVGLRITGNYSQLVTTGTVNVLIERLQFYYDSVYGSNYYPGIGGNSGSSLTIRQCIVQTRQGAGAGYMLRAGTIVNCTVIAKFTGPQSLINLDNGTVRDSTVVKASDAPANTALGIVRAFNPNSVTVVNVGIFGFTSRAVSSDTLNAASTKIYTDDASLPGGTSNATGLTYSAQFQNTTNAGADFRTKAGSNLIGNANRDAAYTFDLDVVGQTRSLTTPTIGAWEVVSSGGVTVNTTGVTGTGAVGTVTATGASTYTASGVSATGSVGTVTATGASTYTASGVSATGSVGTVTATGASAYTASGVSATGAVGTVTVATASGVTVSATGVSATGAVGTVTVTGAANYVPAGVTSIGSVGTVTATGAATYTASGVNAAGSVGTVTITGASIYTASGVTGTGAVGTVTAITDPNIFVLVSGVYAVGAVGTVNVWSSINDTQTPNWQTPSTTQTAAWGASSTSQTPNWQVSSTTQTPAWTQTSTVQSPNWQ